MTPFEISNCFTNNNDGAGFAYITPDRKVHVEKGFMTEEAFIEAYNTIPVYPHVVHFRIATSGDVSPEMTHPYRIEKDSKLVLAEEGDTSVLFHNGVIFDYKTLMLNMVTTRQLAMPKGPINDTRVAAMMMSIEEMGGEDVLSILSGKFVVVRPTGITTWGTFTDVNGVAFSNDGYKRAVQVYNYQNYNKNHKKTKGTGTYQDNGTLTDEEWNKKYAAGYEDNEFYEKYMNCPHITTHNNCNYDCESCQLNVASGLDGKNCLGADSNEDNTESDSKQSCPENMLVCLPAEIEHVNNVCNNAKQTYARNKLLYPDYHDIRDGDVCM